MAKYTVQGKGPITLTNANYITEGGEGKIYGKAGVIYKIYEDPRKMIPVAKIQELMTLNKANILRPLDIVLDANDVPIGFTMQWVQKTEALCKLFTNDFRNRFSITPQAVMKLVEEMQRDIKFIHDKQCLIVDANEMNFLVDTQTFTVPYFIDVNSYQTPHFPATAIMPSIKDYHTKGFSDMTDWFAFAIVSCQLFVGIHPYKGRHPNFDKKDLEKRMKANVSIFNKDVTVPSAARDFSHIPAAYKDWYVELFEKGNRIPPPLIAGMLNLTPVKIQVVQSTDNFIIQFVREFDGEILDYWSYNTNPVAITPTSVYMGKVPFACDTPDVGILFTPKNLTPLKISIQKDDLVAQNLKTGVAVPVVLKASEKMIIGNTLFIRWEDKLSQVAFEEFSENIICTIAQSWNILPNATKVFDGVVYQDVLGVPYLMLPYRCDKTSCCMVTPIPELKGYKIMNAKQSNGVCMVTGFKNNQYDKIILKFNEGFTAYSHRVIGDIDFGEPNFITLDNGIVVSINTDDSLEIFSKNKDANSVKVIHDPDVNSKMTLYKDGITVLFADGKKLYKLSVKK